VYVNPVRFALINPAYLSAPMYIKL
jgi:hypothetical protein